MERDENVHQIEIRLAQAKAEVGKAQEKVRSINEELRPRCSRCLKTDWT